MRRESAYRTQQTYTCAGVGEVKLLTENIALILAVLVIVVVVVVVVKTVL